LVIATSLALFDNLLADTPLRSFGLAMHKDKMTRFTTSHFPVRTYWTGWRRWAAWSICVSALFLLGVLRMETDAEFTFASLALLPVLVIAWIGGRWNGLSIAFLAAVMWNVADIASERPFSAPWIPWANAVTRLMTYSLVALLAAQVRLQLKRAH
jgi:K+-sensing histidine kinase KdpD